MIVKPLVLALWQAFGTIRTQPAGAWRLKHLFRRNGKDTWAVIGPADWGRWNG